MKALTRFRVVVPQPTTAPRPTSFVGMTIASIVNADPSMGRSAADPCAFFFVDNLTTCEQLINLPSGRTLLELFMRTLHRLTFRTHSAYLQDALC